MEIFCLNGLQESLGDAIGMIRPAVCQEHAELITSDARQDILPSKIVLEQEGKLSEQIIAGYESIGVIDYLELVDVQVQDDPVGLVSLNLGECNLYLILEPGAVHQTGQRVLPALNERVCSPSDHFNEFAIAIQKIFSVLIPQASDKSIGPAI